MPSTRGPSCAAPLPPVWLGSADLPIQGIPAGSPLNRIPRSAHGPLFFGPDAGKSPTYRFDCLNGAFAVRYVGLGMAGALVETLLRNPARKLTAYADIAARASTLIHTRRDLNLVSLRGPGLQHLGFDNAMSTGPYDPCGAWADALWSNRSTPDGMACLARHDPREICLALFERLNLELAPGQTTNLDDKFPVVVNLLSSYGKSIAISPS